MLPAAVKVCATGSYVSADASTAVASVPAPPASSTEPSGNVTRPDPICKAPVRVAVGAPAVATNAGLVRRIPSWHWSPSRQPAPDKGSGWLVPVSLFVFVSVLLFWLSLFGVFVGRVLES